jgi:hypothetical protein
VPKSDRFNDKWRKGVFVAYIITSLIFFAAPAAFADSPTLEPPATLQIQKGKLGAIPIGQVFGTLESLVNVNTIEGYTIQVWRYATRFGECTDEDDMSTCDRYALIISVAWNLEHSSQFVVWQSQPRLSWRLAGGDAVKMDKGPTMLTVDLLGCEGSEDVETGRTKLSEQDNVHLVPYRLEVTSVDKVKFWRRPDTGPQVSCGF